METVTWVKILHEGAYILVHANTFGKSMNPSVLPSAKGQ